MEACYIVADLSMSGMFRNIFDSCRDRTVMEMEIRILFLLFRGSYLP
jgi:hypothetical protein